MSPRVRAANATERASPGGAAIVREWLRQAGCIVRKEVLIERRSGEITASSAFFALLITIASSVTLHGVASSNAGVAAAVMWLSVTFATVLAVGKSWQREREERAIDCMLMAPVARSAILVGKTLGIGAFLLVIQALVVAVSTVLFAIDLTNAFAGLALITLLAVPGMAVPSTLFGAMTVQTRARELVLAAVVLPLLLPVLLTSAVATREVLGGASIRDIADYLVILAVFDLLLAGGSIAMFGSLVEARD